MDTKYYSLIVFLLLCLAVGGISGYLTSASVAEWYTTLRKPSFNPPNWIFGPVWTLLYILMGISAWIIWVQPQDTKVALVLFLIQLSLNFAWSIIFFNLKNLGLALVEIGILWLFIVATIVGFFQISTVAALLLAPYLAWVSFATLLNFSLWRLN